MRGRDTQKDIFIEKLDHNRRACPTNGSDCGSLHSHYLTLFVRQHGVLQALIQHNDVRISGRPMIEGTVGFMTLVAVIGFSWGVAVLPDSGNEKQVTKWVKGTIVNSWLSVRPSKKEGQHYFKLTEWLFDHTYQEDDPKGKHPRDSIFHRNLRLTDKLLIANELKPEDEAALTDADEKLREAVLKKTIGLILRGRNLRYADFTGSRMPKVDFNVMEGNGIPTDLRNAKFRHAKLFKSSMIGAQLQGADLTRAQLQGADLTRAQLQGADLTRAQLQGAGLGLAELTLSTFAGAKFGEITAQFIEDLLKRLSGDLKNSKLLKEIEDRFTSARKIPTTFLHGAEGQNIWIEKQDVIVQKAFKESGKNLEVAKSESDYRNRLTAFLIKISCKNQWIASGIIHTSIIPLKTSFAQCLLSLIEKHKSGKRFCPGVSEMSETDIEMLKEWKPRTEPNNKIQPTFKCDTGVSN